jgi:hypothetical protein
MLTPEQIARRVRQDWYRPALSSVVRTHFLCVLAELEAALKENAALRDLAWHRNAQLHCDNLEGCHSLDLATCDAPFCVEVRALLDSAPGDRKEKADEANA